jgi:ferredoxin-type protein NapH
LKSAVSSKIVAIILALLVGGFAFWWYFNPYPAVGAIVAVLSAFLVYFALTTHRLERYRRFFSFGLFVFILIVFVAIIGTNFDYLRAFGIEHLRYIQYYYPTESPGGMNIPCNRMLPQLFLGRIAYMSGPEVWQGLLPITLNQLLFAFIPFFAIALFFGRGFCSWGCPFGGLNETMADGKKERWSLNFLKKETTATNGLRFSGLKPWVKDIKYGVLAAVILLSIVFVFPAVCALCPILWFSNLFAFWLAIALVAIFAVVLPFMNRRRWWCQICPLGAILAILQPVSFFRVRIDKNKCTKCLKCAKECRMYAFTPQTIEGKGTPDADCIRCNRCAEVCPTQAIDTYWFGTSKRAKGVFVLLSIVTVIGWLIWFVAIVADKLIS